jgi:hypothetical protein
VIKAKTKPIIKPVIKAKTKPIIKPVIKAIIQEYNGEAVESIRCLREIA